MLDFISYRSRSPPNTERSEIPILEVATYSPKDGRMLSSLKLEPVNGVSFLLYIEALKPEMQKGDAVYWCSTYKDRVEGHTMTRFEFTLGTEGQMYCRIFNGVKFLDYRVLDMNFKK